MRPEGIKRQVDLGHYVRNLEQGLWATPKGSPSGPDDGWLGRPGSGGDDLATQTARRVRQETWATPQQRDHRSGMAARMGRQYEAEQRPAQVSLPDQAVAAQRERLGQLSARWVSLLMALPADYLSIPPLAGRAGRHVPPKSSTPTSRPGSAGASPKGSRL